MVAKCKSLCKSLVQESLLILKSFSIELKIPMTPRIEQIRNRKKKPINPYLKHFNIDKSLPSVGKSKFNL